MSKLAPTGGKIEYGYNVEIGYYDQENQNLCDSNTVLEELWSAYPTQTEQKIRSTLAWFNFFGEDVYKTVGMLSGGERARLTLSKLILSHMNLLILDEPTNHLDIDSREALESALEEFDGTIIAVSHDRYFIEKLATRIIEICPDGYTDGDMFDYEITRKSQAYSEFREFTDARRDRMEQESESTKAAPVMTAGKEQYLKQKQSASDARKRASRLSRLQKEMADLEEELAATEEKMQGEAATDYKLLAELDDRKNEIEERLMEIYEELEEFEES
jgi:ATP-binding cassette subfamily F protein 3